LALDHSAAGNTAQGLLQRSNQDGKHAKSGLVANPKETARICLGSTRGPGPCSHETDVARRVLVAELNIIRC
jgi:hypothetical protein